MPSLRRTSSPIPRPGTSMNGEAFSSASPLSRSSPSPPPSSDSGLLYSLLNSLDSQSAVLGVYSPRTSRPPEKSRSKGQPWRRALFHFSICFIAGLLIGFTPFSSSNLSMNLMSKYQAFQFDMISTVEKSQPQNSTDTVSIPLEAEDMKNNKKNLTQAEVPRYHVSYDDIQNHGITPELEPRKLLIIVTPTSGHSFQSYYLNRLAQTLRLAAPPLLWIVVEMRSQSAETADILRSTGVMYRHIVCCENATDTRGGRIQQRNMALAHIETHHLDGIVHFADEENIYSVDLFEKMREIRRFGAWTVAKLTRGTRNPNLEGPICNGSLVMGWHINESNTRHRRFHAEISGFAFNSTILWDPERWHRRTLEPVRMLATVKDDFRVSDFIEQIVEDESQMEGLPQDCSRIMVWNSYFEPSGAFYPQRWFMLNNLDTTASLT